MSDTLSNVNLNGSVYEDINTITGITVGSSIQLQNQSREYMKINIGTTQPLVDSDKFFLLKPDAGITATIAAGENRVWVLGEGDLHVEVV